MDDEDEAGATLRLVLPGPVCLCVQESANQRTLRESRNNFEHDPKHEPQLSDSEGLQFDVGNVC